ncbi:DoxX family protein [Bradyrhizobium sp. Cp5.3]|uniref:DoxX family protein n=1 Tax=Bradyrhizobium sp. Cp5.3 TaxID=443598 RepID=UPI0004817D79|nr:DoxX family protein [Bradyrhizobium sp. Cp5.3]
MEMTRRTPHVVAIVRIVVSLLFIEHGTQKLFGFPTPVHGMVPLLSLLGFAALLEIGGGILLLIGFGTRFVAFLLSGEMAVAYFTAHAPRDFFPVVNGGDAAILFCFFFFLLIFLGPGAWSVDGVLKSSSTNARASM